MQTFRATFARGWHATVRAETARQAREALARVGRGETFTITRTRASEHRVFDNDTNDDYEEE